MSRLHRAPEVPVISAAPPAAQDRAARAPAAAGAKRPEPEPPKERKTKVGGFYAYPSELDRIRAAWFHTQTTEDGYSSISELIVRAVLGEGPSVAELERKHNGGEPFDPVPPGRVKHARRAT